MKRTKTQLNVTIVNISGYKVREFKLPCMLLRGNSCPAIIFTDSKMSDMLHAYSIKFYENSRFNFTCDNIEELHRDNLTGPKYIDLEVLEYADHYYHILSPGLWKDGRRICDDSSFYFIALMLSDSAFIPSMRSTFNDEFFFLYEKFIKRQNEIQNEILNDDIYEANNISMHNLNNMMYKKPDTIPSIVNRNKARYIIIKTQI